MNFEKEKMIAGHACMTEENFLTAVSVAKAYETIIYTVVTDFLSGLKMQLSESLGDDWVIEDNVKERGVLKKWSFWLYKKAWEKSDEVCAYEIGFFADALELKSMHFYAMRCAEIFPEKIESVYHALNEQYKIGRNNGYSEWYRYADPLYLNWTEEATLKLLYNKKNMTEYFRQNLLKIIEIVAPIIDEKLKK